MAPRTPSPQVIKTAVLSFFARRIGAAILQWDKKDADAELQQQTILVQQEYERIGTYVALQSDPDAVRAALYAGADALVLQGLGPLTPHQRAQAVLLFTCGLQAYRRHLDGSSDPGHREVMAAMAAHAKAEKLDPAPTPTASTDLASLSSPVGVQ